MTRFRNIIFPLPDTDRGKVATKSVWKLVCVAVVALLFSSGLLDGFQRHIEDLRFTLVRREATRQLLLVDIDEQSIRALGAWPWSRTVHARVIDALLALGAADIAFDVDFSSPATADGDDALEAALKRADGNVVLAAFQQAERIGSGGKRLIESRPLPRFAANAWEAAVNVQPDRDGQIRQFQRGEMFGPTLVPSLASLLGTPGVGSLGRFIIDYGIDFTQLAHVSVSDLLRGAVDPGLVQNRKAIVGASAVELRDLFSVPRFGFIPGSAVQAMAVESLLQDRALMPLPFWLTLAGTVLILLAACLGGRRLTLTRFVALCGVVAVVTEAAAVVAQARWAVVPVTAPVLVGLLALALVAVVDEGVQRRIKLAESRRSGNRLRAMLDRVIADNFAGIVIVDQAGQVCAASAAAAEIVGLPEAIASPCPFTDVLPAPLAALVERALRAMGAGQRRSLERCEISVEGPDGSVVLLDCVVTISQIDSDVQANASDRADHAVCLTFKDITRERQAHDRLLELARIDALSGLANRTVLLAAVDERQAPRPDVASAVILFDLDRFKLVNDRLGHHAGDALIQTFAQKLRTLVAPGDVAARLGGDEFALIVDRDTREGVTACVAALAQALSGTYAIGVYRHAVTLSIGVAFFEGQGTTDIMSYADVALHAAKAAGGGAIRFYDAALKEKTEEGTRLAGELRLAIERGEFEVFYQRQVDAASERIVGVEALVRWRHPERGFISPAKFIPVAERTGLIEPIGAWVLATACREAVAWSEPIKVSVNLSAVQLARGDLADMILGVLSQTGLAPGRLDLELTESLLMEDDHLIRTTLNRLRATGVKISLDDFGTGYSSLQYLNAFDIDKVKIDQSFVRALADRSPATAIIRAVVNLARDLGLRVNAEGVETVEQLDALRRLGCDEIQGYLHGRPEPTHAIEASLVQQRLSRGAFKKQVA